MNFDKEAMERVANVSQPGDKIPYSPYGFMIDPDGIVYAEVHRYCHGAIMSVLYPEKFAAWHQEKPEDDYNKGYDESVPVITKDTPTDDITSCVFGYQRFMFWMQYEVPIVRVSLHTSLAEYAVSKGDEPATPAQIESLRLVLLAQGANLRSVVHLDSKETTMAKALQVMALSREGIDEFFYGRGS